MQKGGAEIERDALLAGIMPDDYWRLTPSETILLLQGHYQRDAQISILLAITYNVNRDPKKSRAMGMEDFSVFRHVKPRAQAQSAQRQRELLEAITIAMGGQVVEKNGG
ncbi:MAG: hypothetical protein DDT37_01878 [Firmicutes bacterium]|nr:hypothetical protein [candidate division NPL-UPA2 bacterium]